ncbi:MAG: ATP synthase F1 subunit delta [Rhodocyclales bacterium GWA2_65_20]|nr:MAG: ATP synthase F1 subunit delta [Rhodocyclales bacterium GWA2_65_20]
MAELVTIARPYAEAVFRLAQEKGRLAAWSEQLQLLADYAANADMAACLANPGLTAAQKADLVKSLLGGAVDGELAGFIQILAGNDRLAVLPEIAAFFETLKAAAEGVKDAVIHSAFPLDDAQRDSLLPTLEAHFKARLRPAVQLDPELIGGIKVVVGDQVLDTSVRASLDAMAATLRT